MSKKSYRKKSYHRKKGLKGTIRVLRKRLYKIANSFLFWPAEVMNRAAKKSAADVRNWGYQTDEVKRNIMMSGSFTGCIFVILWWIFLAVLLIAAIVYLIIKIL